MRLRIASVAAIAFLLSCELSIAQQLAPSDGAPRRFEVVSVKQNVSRPNRIDFLPQSLDGYRQTNADVQTYIRLAYGVEQPLRLAQLAQSAPRRSWMARHPVFVGALIGFGSGFLVGLAGGDDGVFDDFTAEFNGMVVGGIGAGIGAAVGAAVSAASK